MMLMALVIDVSWYWVNSLRVQRAADAAALAGAVLLPSDARRPMTALARRPRRTATPQIGGNEITVTPLRSTPRRDA